MNLLGIYWMSQIKHYLNYRYNSTNTNSKLSSLLSGEITPLLDTFSSSMTSGSLPDEIYIYIYIYFIEQIYMYVSTTERAYALFTAELHV